MWPDKGCPPLEPGQQQEREGAGFLELAPDMWTAFLHFESELEIWSMGDIESKIRI